MSDERNRGGRRRSKRNQDKNKIESISLNGVAVQRVMSKNLKSFRNYKTK